MDKDFPVLLVDILKICALVNISPVLLNSMRVLIIGWNSICRVRVSNATRFEWYLYPGLFPTKPTNCVALFSEGQCWWW